MPRALGAPTNTYGGGRDPSAVIGHAPESRQWTPLHPHFPPRIDDTARIEAFATVDAGMDDTSTEIQAGVWLMKHSHVGHDAQIKQDAEISTRAIIGGHTIVHERARIGIGAVVLPHRQVGADAIVGAGAVVTKDVPPGATVAGNPARAIDRNSVPHTERLDNERWVSTPTAAPASHAEDQVVLMALAEFAKEPRPWTAEALVGAVAVAGGWSREYVSATYADFARGNRPRRLHAA